MITAGEILVRKMVEIITIFPHASMCSTFVPILPFAPVTRMFFMRSSAPAGLYQPSVS
jgi:hypothetical protein